MVEVIDIYFYLLLCLLYESILIFVIPQYISDYIYKIRLCQPLDIQSYCTQPYWENLNMKLKKTRNKYPAWKMPFYYSNILYDFMAKANQWQQKQILWMQYLMWGVKQDT